MPSKRDSAARRRARAAAKASERPPDVTITLQYCAAYRSARWPPESVTRPGWLVDCPEHPKLGKNLDGEQWGYEREATALQVITKHGRALHGYRYHVQRTGPDD